MVYIYLRDTRLSTWLSKYNAEQAQLAKLANQQAGKGIAKVQAGKLVKNVKYTKLKLPSEFLHLHVIQANGIRVTPNIKVNVTDLDVEKGTPYKNFFNKSDKSITFSIDVLIKRNEYWDCALYGMMKNSTSSKFHVYHILKEWAVNMVPLSVTTDAIDIPKGNYIITRNPSRKQTFQDSTVWSLEFTTFNALNLSVYKNNNLAIANASKKAASSAKTTKSSSSSKATLSKCNLKYLVYSKTKKRHGCITLMQQVLYKKGFLTKAQVDGWYGPVTLNAVKKFQKKYQKLYKLKVTGRVDKATLNCMCKV